MKLFEEELVCILEKHRREELNYAEAILAVEKLVVECLGFSAFVHDLQQRITNHQKPPRRRLVK